MKRLSYRDTEKILTRTTRKLYRENMETIKTMAERLKPAPISDVRFITAFDEDVLDELVTCTFDLKWRATEHDAHELLSAVLDTRDESQMASLVLWHIADAGYDMSTLNPKAVESRLPRIVAAMRPRMMKPFEDHKLKPGEAGQMLAEIIEWFDEPESPVAKYLDKYEVRTIPKYQMVTYRNMVGALL